MPFYYKLNQQNGEQDVPPKQAPTYQTCERAVLEYAKSAAEADAFYLYHPVGSEPDELETLLEHGLERIEAGHPAHIIATKGNKTLWEVVIWTPDSM